MLGNDRPNIRFRLRHGVDWRHDARLIRPFIGQTLDQVPGRRHISEWGKECRLVGVQDNLLRPFARGFDPDGRCVNVVRLAGKSVWELRQRPAGYQQKNGECAPDTARYLAIGKADGSGNFGNLDRPMTAMLGDFHAVWRARLLLRDGDLDYRKFSFTISQTSPPRPCRIARAE